MRWTPIAHERGVNTYLSVTSTAPMCFQAWKQEFICFNSCKSKKVDVRLKEGTEENRNFCWSSFFIPALKHSWNLQGWCNTQQIALFSLYKCDSYTQIRGDLMQLLHQIWLKFTSVQSLLMNWFDGAERDVACAYFKCSPLLLSQCNSLRRDLDVAQSRGES